MIDWVKETSAAVTANSGIDEIEDQMFGGKEERQGRYHCRAEKK